MTEVAARQEAPPERTLHVIDPGMLASVQDLGRRGAGWMGVSPSGAADWYSARAANLLVGNDEGRPLIETTMTGATLKIACDALVAVTGADAPLAIGERLCEPWQAYLARAGNRIVVGVARHGIRSYVAIAGGIRVAALFGSSSTDVTSGFGGRVLERGDVIKIDPAPTDVGMAAGRRLPSLPLPAATVLRALPALHDHLAPSLFAATYRVGARSSRQALVLEQLETATSGGATDIVSFGVTAGCVQIANDGTPMVLLVEHQTTGGYMVAACVIHADLPVAGQLRPGAHVRFAPVDVEEAERALDERVRALRGEIGDGGLADRLVHGFVEGADE